MKKLILLLTLLLSTVSAYDLVGTAGAYTNGALGLGVTENFTDSVSYRVLYTREFSKRFTEEGGTLKGTRHCHSKGKEEKINTPVKPTTPTITPPSSKPTQVVTTGALNTLSTINTYNDDFGRLEFDLSYNLYVLIAPVAVSVDVYTGYGYSFNSHVYRDDTFIPVGVTLTTLYNDELTIGLDYAKILDSNGFNDVEDRVMGYISMPVRW